MPTPDEILETLKKKEQRRKEGRLKIYLGMVAGVGKTYAMLKGAHQLKEQNLDVIVGFVETHGRLDTVAQIGDLEILPRKSINHKNVTIEEFDIDEALKRKPQIILIDELAHTNAPNSRHPKRYQDVLEILGQGIDVHTTLNVQHIQSRSDTVAKITGVIVQEIVPDSIIDRADDIVLIDQDPDEIILRLKQGKIYPSERAIRAGDNFFKEGNLTALREIGLRLMAQRVDQELTEFKAIQGETNKARTHHKLIVAVFASPFSEYLIRWTRRHAYALNCPWSAVYVRTSHVLSDEEEALLRKNLATVRELGGVVTEIQDDDVISGILRGAEQQEATQLVVGKPRVRAWWLFWRPHITHSLVYGQKAIDVHVVSPPTHTLKGFKIPQKRGFRLSYPISASSLGNSVLVVAFTTLINLILFNFISYQSVGLIYMLSFFLATMFISKFSILTAATLSALLWNLVFIPPRFTFAISLGQDWLMLLLYLVTAVMLGTFTRRLQRSQERLRQQGNRTDALYRMTKTLAGARDVQEAIFKALEQLKVYLSLDGSVWTLHGKQKIEDATKQGIFEIDLKEWGALQWAYSNRQVAGRFTDTLPSVKGYYTPLIDQTGLWGVLGVDTSTINELSTESISFIQAIAQQLSFALGRDDLLKKLQDQQIKSESEKIYKTLLSSVSHELRTPLTAIQGFSEQLVAKKDADKSTTDFAMEISQNAKRLDRVVQNFLDMGRIESGQMKIQREEIDLEELVRNVWSHLKYKQGNRKLNFQFPSTPITLLADSPLLSQSVQNVLDNSLNYTNNEAEIEIIANSDGRYARLSIADNGKGLGPHPEQVFEKFWRANPSKTGGTGLGLSIAKAFVEFHGGTLTAENIRGGGGAIFKFTLPLKGLA